MQHHLIDLHISESDKTTLLEGYNELLQQVERQLPVQLSALQTALLQVLEQQKEWTAIEQLPSTQHHALHLTHEDSKLLNLPWRLALEGKGYRYLSKGLPTTALPTYQAKIPLPLKILVMIASPENASVASRLSYEQEEASIIEAFQALFEQGNVEIDFTEDGSLESLEAKLRQNHYHILHFSGHGIYKNGIGYLQLEDAVTLHEKLVTAEQFAKSLNKKEKHLPPLILLSSCQSAQGGKSETGFRGVTNQLLQIGVPAVVAMGFSISDYYATNFAAQLYKGLAKKRNIITAFEDAIVYIQMLQKELKQDRLPPQWIIPQLYATKQVGDLLDWQKAAQKIEFETFKLVTGKSKILLEPTRNFLFIGRRKERKKALVSLLQETPKPIFLKGQGGVGKTTLAEHLVKRLVVRNPRTIPFAFNENTTNIQIVLNTLMDFFIDIKKQFLIESEMEKSVGKDAIKQLNYLIRQLELEEEHSFVFIFDNLESFQDGKVNANFKEEYADIEQVIQVLARYRSFPLILTGRYNLNKKAFPKIEIINLNQVSFPSFYVKCQQLNLSELRHKLKTDTLNWSADQITYQQVLQLLYQTIGGNYRALEFFDRLYQQKKSEILPTLHRLEDFQAQIASKGADVIQEMSQNLVFSDLLNLLEKKDLESLQILANFRIPVLEMALQMQGESADLEKLLTLTLVEAHSSIYLNQETLTYYYVTPVVQRLLAENIEANILFNHSKTARYYEYVANNINHNNFSDLEEAFFHYYLEEEKKKINEIGDILCTYYYDLQLFQIAWRYGKQVEQLLQIETNTRIWGNLGIIAELYGNLEIALDYNFKSLKKNKVKGDLENQGTLLNNISQIYNTKGDYKIALNYLNQSLKIQRKIKNKSGEGTVLNNISQIYYAKGDYETTVDYLNQSLKIHREIKDKLGEGRTLNNLGATTFEKGDYKTSLRYLEQSLQIYREIKNKLSEGKIINNISQIYIIRGDYKTALRYLEQALEIFKKINARKDEAGCLKNISQVYTSIGKYKIALHYLELVLQISKKIEAKRLEGGVLNDIGQIYLIIKNYKKALNYLEESLRIYREVGNKSGEGTCLSNLSQVYSAKGDDETALKYLKESLQIHREIGYKLGEGMTLNSISQIYSSWGDFETTLVYLEQSLQIHQEIGYKSGESMTLNNLSQIYSAQDNDEMALSYLQQSLQISQKIGNKSLECKTLNNIAIIFYERGDYKRALDYLEQSLQVYQEIGNKLGEGEMLSNISQIYSTKGDDEIALSYLEQSLEVYRESENRFEESKILNSIIQIYHKSGNYDIAIGYLEKVLQISKEIDDKSSEARTLNYLSEIYSEKEYYETALDYLEQALKISQEIGNKEGEGRTLYNIGFFCLKRANYKTALNYFEHSLKISQEIGDKSVMIPTLHNMAKIALKRDLELYLKYEVEAYQIAKEINDAMGLYQVGISLGGVLCQQGDKEKGVAILQKSVEVGTQAGFPDISEVEALLKQYEA